MILCGDPYNTGLSFALIDQSVSQPVSFSSSFLQYMSEVVWNTCRTSGELLVNASGWAGGAGAGAPLCPA